MIPRSTKVTAVILKRRNIGESDKILTLFTKEQGKLKVVARGIRKITSKRAPLVEVFSHIRLVLYRGRTLDVVGEVAPLAMYQDLRTDLRRVSVAYYICELVDALLPEKQEHADVFALLINQLGRLDITSYSKLKDEPYLFSVQLLQMLGYLDQDDLFKPAQMWPYIESILERDLKTPKILRQLLRRSS